MCLLYFKYTIQPQFFQLLKPTADIKKAFFFIRLEHALLKTVSTVQPCLLKAYDPASSPITLGMRVLCFQEKPLQHRTTKRFQFCKHVGRFDWLRFCVDSPIWATTSILWHVPGTKFARKLWRTSFCV